MKISRTILCSRLNWLNRFNWLNVIFNNSNCRAFFFKPRGIHYWQHLFYIKITRMYRTKAGNCSLLNRLVFFFSLVMIMPMIQHHDWCLRSGIYVWIDRKKGRKTMDFNEFNWIHYQIQWLLINLLFLLHHSTRIACQTCFWLNLTNHRANREWTNVYIKYGIWIKRPEMTCYIGIILVFLFFVQRMP